VGLTCSFVDFHLRQIVVFWLSGGVIRPNLYLVSMMLVAVVALMASIPNQFAVDSISRDLRLICLTVVLCFSFGWGGSDFIRLGLISPACALQAIPAGCRRGKQDELYR
jgi:hypothetical protein